MQLTDPDEVFYAETAREMLARGEFLTPFIFGEPQFEKPPLYYWLVIFSYKLFGVNEFAARLPSAIVGILGVLGVYFLAEIFFKRKTAFLASIILATSTVFLILSRACVTDILLTVSVLYVLLFFFKERYLAASAALALATLTKGPIGIFLPVVIIGIYLILTRRLVTEIKKIPILKALFIFLLLAAPWYFLMYKAHGKDFIDVFFGFHNIKRFMHPEHAWGDVFYYYIPTVLVGYLPWTLFLPAAAWNAFSEKEKTAKKANLFLLVWFLVVFLFFSFSRTKLPTYIFPLFPALAIFTAQVWSSYLEGSLSPRLQRAMKFSLYLFIFAMVGASLGFYIFARIEYPVIATPALLSGLLFSAVLLLSVIEIFKKRQKSAFILFTLSFVLFSIPLSYIILPEVGRYESSKAVSQKLMELAKPGEVIGAETQYRRGVAFYTGRENIPDVHRHHVITTLLAKPERAWCVIKEKNHIQLYTDPKHYYYKPTYVVYQLGKKVILTNNPPEGVPILKVRTKNDPY